MRMLVGFAVCGLAMSGCVSRSEGQLGHASFSYVSCLFGCDTSDNSLAAGGARAGISVALSPGYTFAAVHSTDPTVFTASIGTNTVDVVSGRAGSAQLQLLDANGKLVDQATLTVEATASLGVTRGWGSGVPLVLAATTQMFHVTTTDANGRATIGTGSVVFQMSGPLSAVSPLIGDGDAQYFVGTPGAGGVVATAAGGAQATLDVTVVPASAITGLQANVHGNVVDSSGTYVPIDIVTNAGATPVYGGLCAWTMSDPSVTVRTQTVASLEQAAMSSTQLTLASAGSFTATCTVGTASTTVHISR
jgi:hypothetical protein